MSLLPRCISEMQFISTLIGGLQTDGEWTPQRWGGGLKMTMIQKMELCQLADNSHACSIICLDTFVLCISPIAVFLQYFFYKFFALSEDWPKLFLL